jgi:hypothetical protein
MGAIQEENTLASLFHPGYVVVWVDDRTRYSDDRNASTTLFVMKTPPHTADWDIDMDACRPANQCQTWHWTWNYRYHA